MSSNRPRGTSLSLPPGSPTFQRHHERFPSAHLQEDFVRIQSWNPQPPPPPDSPRRRLPFRLLSFLDRIPRKWRILLVAAFFVLLFLVACAIVVVLIVFVFHSSDDSDSHNVNSTLSPPTQPGIKGGRLQEITVFFPNVSGKDVVSLAADPVNKDRFLAFDQASTVTVMEKNADGVRVTKVILDKVATTGDCTILGITDNCLASGKCGSESITFCCVSERLTCSVYGNPLTVGGKLSAVSLQPDALHIITNNKDVNGCNVQHYMLNKTSYEAGAATDCGWSQNPSTHDFVFATGINKKDQLGLYLKAGMDRNGRLFAGPSSFASPKFSVPFGIGIFYPTGFSSSRDLLFASISNDTFNVALIKHDYLYHFELKAAIEGNLKGAFFNYLGTLDFWYIVEDKLQIATFIIEWDS